MAVLFHTCTYVLLLIRMDFCYKNLAMKPESYVELSTMLGHNYPARANDGDLRQNILYCSHTDNGQSKAWLRVNLGERYQIQEVKIFYRNSEIKTDRFNNFYIDVSNNTFERYRCYTDNKPGTPAEIETISCRHIAQYVTVETTYFSHGGVYLEIAEIQVFGCSIQVNNYQCPNECESGKFGQKCSDSCGGNCVNITCSRNGECDGGCKNGWTGSQCDSPCPEGFYGGKCLEQCNHNCAAGCNHIHGDCIQGCSAVGLQPKRCDSRCLPRYYGLNCVSLCSSGCAESGLCHPENGTCVAGCNPGYSGNLCLSGVTLEQQNPIPFSVIIEDPEEEPIREDPAEAVYYNNLSAAKDIDVKDLLLVIEDKEQKENAGFTKEFKELPYGERFDCNTAKLEENIPKNRFKTTFPYNHSRVVLQIDDEFSSDYINANYIENMEGTRAYIASQGPKENTLVDHWRMIWQEKVNYIVMLTSLIEGRKVKCHQYWPDENDKLEIGPFTIHLTEEKQYTNFIKRTMTLKKREVTKPRTVVQFHYTRWPDHGTPNPLNLTNFHEHFKHNSFISNSPVLVHCSAGIGRTGTLIALDALEKYGRKTGKFNVIEFVRAMRKNRMSMIQNIDQYIFLYHALYETFRRKSVFIKRHDFTRIFSQTDKRETRKQITDEFNDLTKLKPKYDASDYRSGKKYLNMNAVKTVLPVERYLVYLSSSLRGREPYYNAVTLSSFTSAEEFISAQHPVPGAGVDLLLLLTEQACPFLISLNPIEDINEVNHWFNDKEKHITIGPFGITKVDQKRFTEEVRKTIIKVQRKQEKGSHTIQIFECLDWNTADFIPEKCSTLIELIKQFCLDRRSNPEGQITILSRDGATCCGVFCAVYNAIEQLQQDDEVDIFTIVQQLQCRRPEMISNKEEYEFCYKAVCAYLETENIYANTSS
ncbi:receptor-type tyrosine-protein phosphatase kappa-like [Saccostrea echinata]|uniref:receptor-type tyrosine-protein phosphatase kappa-like n=1 Tax=Saccostrea echinata TaxID=191078 RepID=UPI002A7FF973|nr:receptor-type tyrosine-protein phosphatase kappa-like [Saccostrea echinata]